MGCGNNKVSRDYLTSQPVTTPSPKATKARAANLGSQVMRVIAEVSRESADRAARVRAQAAREAESVAAAKARADADRKAAMTAAKKAADQEESGRRELEEIRGLLANAAYHAITPALEEYQRLPGQPERIGIVVRGEPRTVRSWVRHVTDQGVEELVDAGGEHTHGPLHIHTRVRSDGTVFMQGTDRRGGEADHFGRIEVLVPDAPDELLDAAFELVAEMLRERE